MCGGLVPSLNDYRGHELLGFYVFAITLAYLAVMMRFVSQRIARLKIGADDYLVVVALVRHVLERITLDSLAESIEWEPAGSTMSEV